jgi:hypothetical protein
MPAQGADVAGTLGGHWLGTPSGTIRKTSPPLIEQRDGVPPWLYSRIGSSRLALAQPVPKLKSWPPSRQRQPQFSPPLLLAGWKSTSSHEP